MTLHVYALTEHPATLPQARGIGGGELKAVDVGHVDVVVSDLPAGAGAGDEETVLEHARVVDELLAANDAVLPGRFGNGFEAENALREAIGPRVATLRDALERVRGNVEIGLRVIAGERQHGGAPAATGREYLAGRLADVQAAARAAEQIHAPLAASARADTLNVLATPDLLLSAAYLIPRADVDAFRARVAELDAAHLDLTFVCTGPWPPYSFATLDTEKK